MTACRVCINRLDPDFFFPLVSSSSSWIVPCAYGCLMCRVPGMPLSGRGYRIWNGDSSDFQDS